MFEQRADTGSAKMEVGQSVWDDRDLLATDWPPDAPDDNDDVVQRLAVPVDPMIYGIEDDTHDVHAAAARGLASSTTELPFFEQIQRSFGVHDISGVQAHVGGSSASEMGAKAFAAGNHVVFDRTPDLHTAAHEVAHVVQQARGVNLYGGVGEAGDTYERAADAVADRVVAGQSAEDLLGAPGTALASSMPAVQRKEDTSTLKSRADGDRVHAIDARLRLGAMQIQNECDTLLAVVNGTGNDPEAAMKNIVKPAYARVAEVQGALIPIWEDMQKLRITDGALRSAFGIFNTARRRFSGVTQEVKGWASRHKVNADGVSSTRIDTTADRFARQLVVESTGNGAVWGTEDKKTTKEALIMAAVADSINAVENSVTALSQAMREDDAKTTAPGLATRALVDLRLLDTSIPPNAATSEATAIRIAKIAHLMQRAFRDASPHGLDKSNGDLIFANDLMGQVKRKIDNARSAKGS